MVILRSDILLSLKGILLLLHVFNITINYQGPFLQALSLIFFLSSWVVGQKVLGGALRHPHSLGGGNSDVPLLGEHAPHTLKNEFGKHVVQTLLSLG